MVGVGCKRGAASTYAERLTEIIKLPRKEDQRGKDGFNVNNVCAKAWVFFTFDI